MTRPVDPQRRDDLLDQAVDYVCANGLADLSLRPLAKALGASPRSLLYHFGSKEALIVEIIARGRARQRAMMNRLAARGPQTSGEIARELWNIWSEPRWRALTRLFFEVYVLSLQEPQRFAGFAAGSIEDWLAALQPCFLAQGYPAGEARAHATAMLAMFRGFLLDLAATGDRERLDRAAHFWFARFDRDVAPAHSP